MLGFPEYSAQAKGLARAAGLNFAEIEVHHFPDGESRIRLPEHLPETVFICRSLNQPNEKLIELILAVSSARELGARKITLVAPYLAYMRQDKAFHPGEAVSQKIVGNLLATFFDALITVDPHLHRVHRIEDAVPIPLALTLSATTAMSSYLEGKLEKPILIGPDEESEQWVAAIAQQNDLEFYVARKLRFGDRDVSVSLPNADYRERHVVFVDDVISTGRTIESAIKEIQPYQPASITVMVTHALFAGDALKRLKIAGANEIWSTDSIPHPTNRIELAGCLAQKLMAL
ncbi:ribose-phosphate diphosphokinase [Luminiphilus syltensis]|uniref:ribose-phosphate diphosphokinase n=1 Tax=Luminiphilus syltensis TaxID=1341119 RepID=UPI001E2AB304|nr:ribose-phosphate diphosphokinase [Luminiphilus syltensis]